MNNSDAPPRAEESPALPALEETSERSAGRRKLLRIVAVVVALVALFVIGHLTGATEHLTRDKIQAFMEGAGVVGFLGFLLVFAIGELVHVPGMVFVAAAVLAYGQVLGFAAGYIGAILATLVSFLVVRLIGGQPLAEIKRPLIKKIMDRLEDRPILVIAALRIIFWLLPAINYALAMSNVKTRDYVLGTALGLIGPIAFATFFIDQLLEWTS